VRRFLSNYFDLLFILNCTVDIVNIPYKPISCQSLIASHISLFHFNQNFNFKLTAIIQSRRHIMRMDDNADAKRILLASPPADWRRQPGRPHITWLSTIQQDLKHYHLTLPEASDLAQNRPLWRMMSTYRELHARNDDDEPEVWPPSSTDTVCPRPPHTGTAFCLTN